MPFKRIRLLEAKNFRVLLGKRTLKNNWDNVGKVLNTCWHTVSAQKIAVTSISHFYHGAFTEPSLL